MVSVDMVVFAITSGRLEVLVIQRKHDPYAGQWAMPGGFVEMDETLEAAAIRELKEETGVEDIHLQQFHAFGDPGRDPRGRCISIAFLGVTDRDQHDPRADDDAADVTWLPVADLPELAFDHNEVVACAVRNLRTLAQNVAEDWPFDVPAGDVVDAIPAFGEEL
jgi:8-oxo-dGTP diphosphatase